MKTGDIFYLTAVSMDGMDEITTPMPIMALQDGDPMEMIKAASIEYCRTRQGLADYDGNGRNFDLADFWYQVPNALCVKHGFKKLDSGDAATESADEPLFQLEDLALTENLLEDVYNELTAGPADELEDMLVLCGYDGDLELLQNGTEAEIEATIREYISCVHNDAARTDILEYWMDHCASIYAGCGDGAEGITEAAPQSPRLSPRTMSCGSIPTGTAGTCPTCPACSGLTAGWPSTWGTA